jgi:pyruvate dehydrogenase E1 component alpha subunit
MAKRSAKTPVETAPEAVRKSSMDKKVTMDLLYQMLLIRRFEEKAAEMYSQGKIGGFLHLDVGMEASCVGAISNLRPDDYAIGGYREHGHFLAKGGDPRRAMAELFGRIDGMSKGKGGSMHFFDKQHNFLGGTGIVGGQLPIGTGAGLAISYQGGDQVCLVFFGDGSVAQGTFHESLNLASLWRLPVIYICENNQYAMSTHWSTTNAVADLSARGQAFGIPSATIDGMDGLAVYEAVSHAVARARAGQGPSFLVAMTYRFLGHHIADSLIYRTREETDSWREKDPIKRLQAQLIAAGALSEAEAAAMTQQAADDVEAAALFARESPEPDPDTLLTDIYG